MKISKLKIENLFGIEQLELDGKSVELTGSNGVGKSSVLDAIREQEKREQNDIVYNYRNYVVNKDYSYEIYTLQSNGGCSNVNFCTLSNFMCLQ